MLRWKYYNSRLRSYSVYKASILAKLNSMLDNSADRVCEGLRNLLFRSHARPRARNFTSLLHFLEAATIGGSLSIQRRVQQSGAQNGLHILHNLSGSRTLSIHLLRFHTIHLPRSTIFCLHSNGFLLFGAQHSYSDYLQQLSNLSCFGNEKISHNGLQAAFLAAFHAVYLD